jgi:hypothetical protein
MSRATWLQEKWPEVDFSPFFKKVAKKQHHPLVSMKFESQALRNFCAKTGQLINMHDDYEDLPNMYLETGISPVWLYEKGVHEREITDRINSYVSGAKNLSAFMN